MATWYSDDGRGGPFFSILEPFEPSPENLEIQRTHIVLARSSASEAGFELDGFLMCEDVELYYHVLKNRERICCLTKGWGDPGFVISNSKSFISPEPNYDYKKVLELVSRICSQYMLVQTYRYNPSRDECPTIIFQTPIYSDGFNGKTFKEAVRNMEEAFVEISSSVDRGFKLWLA